MRGSRWSTPSADTGLGWTVAALAPVESRNARVLDLERAPKATTIACRRSATTALLLLVGLSYAIVTSSSCSPTVRLLPLVIATDVLIGAAIGGAIVAIWTEPDNDDLGEGPRRCMDPGGARLVPPPRPPALHGGCRRSTDDRVLDELDGVELVATRAGNGLDVRLARGERLILRRRA